MVHEQISNCQLLPLFDHVIKQGHEEFSHERVLS